MAGAQSRARQRSAEVEKIRASLPEGPLPWARPVLVVISGLPGSGKSYFSRRLVGQMPLLVLESDVLRKVLFPNPSYTATESARLFQATHALIEDLLSRGIPILLDSTNLIEGHRERLYQIADRLGVKLIVVHIVAPPEVVYGRLEGRSERIDSQDHSSADFQVYQRMRPTVEPIKRSHFVVDTSRDITLAIAKITQQIGSPMRGLG